MRPISVAVLGGFAVVILIVVLTCGAAFSAQGENKEGAEKAQTVEKTEDTSKTEVPKGNVDVAPTPNERATPIETETLDAAGEKLGKEVDAFGKKIEAVFGSWVNVKFWRGITWLKLLASALLLVVFIVIERTLSARLKATARKIPVENKSALSKKVLLEAITSPLSFLILVYGAYASISPLFKHFQDTKGRNVVHDVAENMADLGGTLAVVWLIYRLIRAVDALMQSRLTESPRLVHILIRRCRGPVQILIMLVVIRSLLPVVAGVPHLYSILTNLLSLVFIGTVAWLITQAVYVASDHFLVVARLKGRNPYYVRKIETQIQFLRRLTVTLIILVGVATGMMVFDKVRQLGTSILASAGIAGVIVGFSAQRTLANLLVGLQIAITQPIRIGDLVTVENETGTIQEINSTFAIVQTWDQRRLIIPLTYFTEKLFQNLTLSSSELLGTVALFVDYSVPVEVIRQELHRIVQESSYWDQRTWALNVANLKENSVELTALVSAQDSGKLGSLRGEVREKLLAFLQINFPQGLPRVRAELDLGKAATHGGNGGTGSTVLWRSGDS
jgi:small-conductance mechanosensitive channel